MRKDRVMIRRALELAIESESADLKAMGEGSDCAPEVANNIAAYERILDRYFRPVEGVKQKHVSVRDILRG